MQFQSYSCHETRRKEKIFPQGKNRFVAKAACSKVAKPEFAWHRRDAFVRHPVQRRHRTGPARAANGKGRLDGGDAYKVNTGDVRFCTRGIRYSRHPAKVKGAPPQQNKDRTNPNRRDAGRYKR